jgi:hypothetical protein
MKIICKNCETPNYSDFNYCPQCSQKVNLHRISPHEVLHEAIHYFTHADKGIFQLVRDLTLKSGVVAQEYINGKRKKYFPPLNFFLLVAAIFVFISNIPKEVAPVDIQKENSELNNISNPAEKEKMIHLYERKEKTMHFIRKYSNLMAMMALPLTAFFFLAILQKRKIQLHRASGGRYVYVRFLHFNQYLINSPYITFTKPLLKLQYRIFSTFSTSLFYCFLL